MSNLPAPESATLTIDQLRLSPFNVRLNAVDARPTAPLKASIAAAGVEQSLAVHPMRGSTKLWGVLAGGRRYRCVRELVDEGVLPADFPVPVLIHHAADVEIVARSLDENLMRKDLRSYEVCAAIVREHRLGRTIEQIAERHGQETTWVQRAVRLGSLNPQVFEAYASGRLSTEQAQAFGATADLELQGTAFAALIAGPEHGRTPAAIRAWLRVDDHEAGKLLRFIGEETYYAAGGAFEPNLFADGGDESGRVTDDPLLRRLADAKITALREATRAELARPDLRFVPQGPRAEYGGPEWMLLVTPEETGGRRTIPDGDIVAAIAIGDDGAPDVTFWWTSRKAMSAASGEKARATPPRARVERIAAGAAIGQQYDNSRQAADAAIKEEAGLTQDGTAILRSVRRSILRAALIQSAREGRPLGRDYLVWAQLRLILSRAGKFGEAEREAQVGMRRLCGLDGDSDAAAKQIDATEAGKIWSKALRELQGQSFLTETDLGAALLDFLNAPQAMRDLAGAVVAGMALERSLDADGYRVPVHDTLAVQARVAHPQGIRHYWQPSTAFLELLPTAERRSVAQPFVDRSAFETWGKLKSAELTPLVLRVVQGTAPSAKKSMQVAAAQWVHPLLAFNRSDRTLADVYAEQAELEDAE